MLETRMNPKSKSLLRLTSRLLCLLALLSVAGYLTATRTAEATDRFSCNLGGGTVVSCGSSAGNFIFQCDSNGCRDTTDANNQFLADSACARYTVEGCPGNLFGDGGDDWIGGIIGE